MELMTPLLAIGGGLLIGSAAALLLLLTGRVAGVSGMHNTRKSSPERNSRSCPVVNVLSGRTPSTSPLPITQ